MEALERHLADFFGASACLLFGRGSTGLYALFRHIATETPDAEVLIPELCCETVPLAAIYAGLRPVFVDVDPATLGMSVAAATASIGRRTRAIVLIHLFGIPADTLAFRDLCARRRITLIEDLAQSVGGRVGGQPLGRGAEVTLLSFDDRKILRGSGGALLLGRTEHVEALTTIRDTIEARTHPPSFARLALSLRNLTHALCDLSRASPATPVSATYRALLGHYEAVVVTDRRRIRTDTIPAQLARLDATLERRFERYHRYVDAVASSQYEVLEAPQGTMWWRVPVVFRQEHAALAAAARLGAAGIPASNHYFPLGTLFSDTSAPIAGDLGRRLLNLWVDDCVSDRLLETTIGLLEPR